MAQANFPILGANVSDTGAYGLAAAQGGQGVKPYIEKTLGGVKVAVLGITNHRVPNYELPSNIPGLTFSDPLAKAQDLSNQLRSANDVVIALTHIGFTTNPKSVEVDDNVDTNFAAQVPGVLHRVRVARHLVRTVVRVAAQPEHVEHLLDVGEQDSVERMAGRSDDGGCPHTSDVRRRVPGDGRVPARHREDGRLAG